MGDRAWREANAAHLKDAKAAWYAANRERLVEKARAYRLANPDKSKAAVKNATLKKAGKYRSYHARRYAANPEPVKRRSAVWARLNPERARELAVATKQRRRFAVGTLSASDIRNAHELCGDICAYCAKSGIEIEHCTPLSRGGWNSADNVVIACRSCNAHKGAKTVLEFLGLWLA